MKRRITNQSKNNKIVKKKDKSKPEKEMLPLLD
jgi:hypothetical protein